MKRAIVLFFNGIAYGCTISSIIMMIGVAVAGRPFLDMSPGMFIKQILGAMITGVGFILPTLIYKNDKLSLPLKTLFHMGIGFIIYFTVAFNTGWIPTGHGIFLTVFTVISAVLVSGGIWLGFYLYNRNEAKKINKKMKTNL